MPGHSTQTSRSWLVWIYGNDIRTILHAAPRLEITREMRELGWEVDLIVYGPTGKHLVQGTEVLCFPRPRTFFLGNVIFHFHVIRYLFRHWKQISVVLFYQLSALWILPLRLLRVLFRQGPVFVMDTRTVPMERKDKATRKDKLKGQFFLFINRVANWLADGQTTITERMAKLLAIPSKRLWGTWPSGVNTDQFLIASPNRVWPGHKDPVVVIYIGTLNYERNLMALCQAVVDANRRGMHFILWLYGEGNEKRDLQAYAQQSGGAVMVFDAVPNEQVPQILASAHVGVLPFPDEEKYRVSSPIKLFEYMGAGMPILATRVVCHTDVIGNGEYVFWAENSDVDSLLDALQKTWQCRAMLPGMGQKALSASRDWTWGNSAKRLHGALKYGLSLYKKESRQSEVKNVYK